MKESTKKNIEKTGKILLGIAEASAGYMESNAKSCARNNKFPDEYRDKYADMADGFGSLKDTLHECKSRIGQQNNQLIDCEEMYDYEDYAEYDDNPNDNVNDGLEIESIRIPKCYTDIEKAQKQIESASKDDLLEEDKLDEWESKWLSLGRLTEINCDIDLLEQVGIIRLLCNNEVVYIIRAIELKNGGISKKLKEFQQQTIKKKSKAYIRIAENLDDIFVEVIYTGNNMEAVDLSRNLEKRLLTKYNPSWR